MSKREDFPCKFLKIFHTDGVKENLRAFHTEKKKFALFLDKNRFIGWYIRENLLSLCGAVASYATVWSTVIGSIILHFTYKSQKRGKRFGRCSLKLFARL